MRAATRKKRTRLLAQRRRHATLMGEVLIPPGERSALPLAVAEAPHTAGPEAEPPDDEGRS